MKTLMKTLLKLATPLTPLALFHLSAAPVLAQSTISTYAGAPDPSNGAQATTVSFANPTAVISDRAGGFYVSASYPQHSVYRVAADGTVTIIAGVGTYGYSGDGGPATSAQLSSPGGLALDGPGNLFIADTDNYRIRKVTTGGVISTFAGSGTAGFAGDGGPATSARLNRPQGIVFDGSGNLLIADTNNHRIRKVTTGSAISTVAGVGGTGSYNGDGIPATSASLNFPYAVALDGSGNLLIADSNNYRVRKVSSGGIITTVAGTGSSGFSGDGALATAARISFIQGVSVDGSGNLLIADSSNNRIRKVGTDGIISTVAGTGAYAFGGDGGPATAAQLANPNDIFFDGGNLLIVDSGNNRIRQVNPAGTITTIGGNGTYGYRGDNGPAFLALLNIPMGVATDAAGNLYIADSSNARVRKVTPSGIITTIAGNGIQSTIVGENVPATSTSLYYPGSVAVGPDGSVYIADCTNRIRKVTTDGIIRTLAQNFGQLCYLGYYYDDTTVGGLAVDSQNNVIVAAPLSERVYKVTQAGAASVVAGTNTSGFSGDGGPATAARLNFPWGIALDTSDNLYIADAGNNRIRKVKTDGTISTVAGNNATGAFDGDGGAATSARLNYPNGVAVDPAGNIFIADTNNYRIRKVSLAGTITTVAGNGSSGSGGDGGPPTLATLGRPTSIALTAAGDVFISDSSNYRIRKVVFALTVPTLTNVSPGVVAQGATVSVALQGTSFTSPMTINAGSGITVSNVLIPSETFATATFTIGGGAPLGPRNINVTTSLGTSGDIPLTVALPFPDVSITSSHSGNLGVGFNETFVIGIANVGTAPTTSPMTVKDTLPDGLTYVSGTGTGWSCSAADQLVNCVNSDSLAVGSSTTLNLVVAVGGSAASGVNHAPSVDVAGDLITSNNTASDPTNVVPVPTVSMTFTPSTPVAGTQATLDLTIFQSFPHDITGTLTLSFSPTGANPADDPAIQFATGGRQVTYVIPANTSRARFGSNTVAAPISFQTGTVAGTISFNTTLQVGSTQTTGSASRVIPQQAPKIQSVQREGTNRASFTAVVNLFATPRQVTQLILSFNTSPAARADCGSVPGCTASGSSVTIDVKSMFDSWFIGNPDFGSTSILRVPLSIGGSATGTASIQLRNLQGLSNSVSFTLP